jgi:hypothetical protein
MLRVESAGILDSGAPIAPTIAITANITHPVIASERSGRAGGNPRGLFDGVSLGDEGKMKVVSFAALETLQAHAVRRAMIACVECGALMVAVVKCPPIAKKEAADCDLSPVVAIFKRTNSYSFRWMKEQSPMEAGDQPALS